MSEVGLINLSVNRHLVKCPHCGKQTAHKYPGTVILFASPKCTHCGREFVIMMNEPRS